MYDHLNPNNTPIVRINWEDIYFTDNWSEDSDENVQPRECTCCGYLLENTPSTIVVAGSYEWRSEQWATIHAIPKSEPEIVVIRDQTGERPPRELVDFITEELESEADGRPDDQD